MFLNPGKLGRQFFTFLQLAGQVALLAADVARCLFRYRIRWALLINQIDFIGIKSVPVVIITGGFIGAVFAAQTEYQFRPLGMSSAVGPVVSVAMCRELGPVLCALMIAGRVGSAMAAELATMKITEQIDALRSLAVYPTEYLIVPRVLAMLVSMPILVAIAIIVGVLAGYLVAVDVVQVPGVYYLNNMEKYTHAKDILIGLVKGLFFGIFIVLISCNKGLHSSQGAEGVGLATTESVVDSFIVVLISNFFFTMFLNDLFDSIG
jgi:phospholipid/cholesterol/gamma-HCH transport system permease protein